MKTLVTHINPHLDDITAIWLFKKFHPQFKKAKVRFLSAAKKMPPPNKIDNNPNVIYFGVGMGKFDEHKGDIGECATSLVWKDIKSSALTPKDQTETMALDELVEWNRLLDTAQFPQLPFGDFSVPTFLRPTSGKEKDSLEAYKLGEQILERILKVLVQKMKLKIDWGKHLEFKTKWGSTAAISSNFANRGQVRDLGEGKYSLILIYRPEGGSVEFFSDREGVDLTPLYLNLTKEDPEAGWFLHHVKRMILCGGRTAPDAKPTKLSFEQLIEIAKSI